MHVLAEGEEQLFKRHGVILASPHRHPHARAGFGQHRIGFAPGQPPGRLQLSVGTAGLFQQQRGEARVRVLGSS